MAIWGTLSVRSFWFLFSESRVILDTRHGIASLKITSSCIRLYKFFTGPDIWRRFNWILAGPNRKKASLGPCSLEKNLVNYRSMVCFLAIFMGFSSLHSIGSNTFCCRAKGLQHDDRVGKKLGGSGVQKRRNSFGSKECRDFVTLGLNMLKLLKHA